VVSKIVRSAVAFIVIGVLWSCSQREQSTQSPQLTPPAPSQPNVLLITLDTCRADRLGCYGYGIARTFAIDALAKDGVRCANHITTAPITMPAHASILTGLYPPAHGVRDNGAYALDDRAVTLAECFKQNGYSTFAAVSALVLSRRYNLTQGFDEYDDDLYEEDNPKLFMIRDRPAPKTAQKTIQWLEQWRTSGAATPFFAWVHFFDPHQPMESRAPDRNLCPTQYDAEIAQADDGVELLVNWLKAKGILDSTLVVVTADHGESLGEHKEKTHAIFIYDATVHVPLIWRYPALFRSGTVYEGATRAVDLMPTILAAAQVGGGGAAQGQNLLPALQGISAPPTLPQYSESLLSELGFGMAPLYGIRDEGLKYIRAPRSELYDLKTDPRELTNLFTERTDDAGRLERELQRILDASEGISFATQRNPLDEESEEMLQALGYLAPSNERQAMGGMDPKDGIVYHQKLEDARHLAQRTQWAQAEVVLKEILETLPTHLSARNTLALTLMKQEKRQEAEEQYKLSLEQEPNQGRILHMMGVLNMRRNNIDEAKQYFHKALEVTPKFIEPMIHLGYLEAKAGNMEQSQAWYDKAIQEEPASPRPAIACADLYYLQEDYAVALEYYKKAVAMKPRHFEALVLAGACSHRTGDYAGAAEYYDKAAALRPDSWLPPYNMACLLVEQGKHEEAIQCLKNSLACDTGDRALPKLFETDKDLDPIRSLPAFLELKQQASSPRQDEDAPRKGSRRKMRTH